MSMMGGGRMRGVDGDSPVGETVASFSDYARAQKTVSTLVSADIPARDIAIVGNGLRSIERVTGRLGWATAARTGALNGVLLGIFFAAIIVIGTPDAPIQMFAGVVFVGIAFGMLLSLVSYSVVRRRRDYASVVQVAAEHYEVTVSAKSVHKARQTLGRETAPNGDAGRTPGAGTTPHAGGESPPISDTPGTHTPAAPTAPAGAPAPAPAEPDADEPPRYGERLPSMGAAASRSVSEFRQASTA